MGQLQTSVPLQPARITVQPSPSLVVKYFIDSSVQVPHDLLMHAAEPTQQKGFLVLHWRRLMPLESEM